MPAKPRPLSSESHVPAKRGIAETWRRKSDHNTPHAPDKIPIPSVVTPVLITDKAGKLIGMIEIEPLTGRRIRTDF